VQNGEMNKIIPMKMPPLKGLKMKPMILLKTQVDTLIGKLIRKFRQSQRKPTKTGKTVI